MQNKVSLELLLQNARKVKNQLSGIKGGGKQAADALKATRDNLNRTNHLAGKLNGLRRARVELRQNQLASAKLNKNLISQRHALAANQTEHQRNTSAVKNARNHYNRLSRTLAAGKGDTTQFRAEFERARQTLERTQSSAQKTTRAGQKLRAAIKTLNADSRRLSDRQQQLTRSAGELKDKLAGAGIASKHLGNSERRLRREADALNRSYQRQQSQLAKLASRRQRLNNLNRNTKSGMGTSLTGAAAGVGYSYLATRGAVRGAQFLNEGLTFDKAMSKVQALARLKKDSGELSQLRGQARDLGANTSFSANDVASGQGYLAMAGFNAKAIQDAMPSILNLSLAGDLDLGETSDIGSNILGGFKLDASKMAMVADVLSKTFTTSNTTLQSLGETMKYVGPVAATAGTGLAELAAYAGLLGDTGIKGSDAGTALRAMLLRLSAPTAGAKDALDSLGINVADKNGNMRNITELVEELAWATQNLGSTEKLEKIKAIFGERPASAMAILLDKAGSGHLRQYVKDLNDSANEAKKLSSTMTDNLDGDIKGLSSAWADVKIQIFGENNKALRELTQLLTGTIRKMGAWEKANPELVQKLTKWAAAGLALTAILGGLTAAVFSLLIPLLASRWLFGMLGLKLLPMLGAGALKAAGGFKVAAKALLWLGRAALMNPIGLVIAAIAGGAFLIYKHWAVVKAFFSGFWGPISDAFSSAAEELGIPMDAIKNGLKPIGKVFSWIGEKVALAVQWFGRLINPVQASQAQLDSATNAGERLGKAVANILKMAFSPIKLLKSFHQVGADLIKQLIAGMLEKLPDIKARLSGIVDSIKGIFSDDDGLDINSPSKVFKQFGSDTMAGYGDGIAKNQQRALAPLSHLSKAATVAVGATLATPLAAQIDSRPPLQPSAQAVQVQGDTINITISNASGNSAQDIARQIEQVLQERDRAKSRRVNSALFDR